MSNLSVAWEKSVFSRFPLSPASEGHTTPGSLTHFVLELLLPMVNGTTGGAGVVAGVGGGVVGGGVGGGGVGGGVGPQLKPTLSNNGDPFAFVILSVAVLSNIVVASDTLACGICS